MARSVPIRIEISIRDPEKNPNEEEREALLSNISLLERFIELRPSTFQQFLR